MSVPWTLESMTVLMTRSLLTYGHQTAGTRMFVSFV